MLAYVNDCIVMSCELWVVSCDPEMVMVVIGDKFEVKNNEYGPPTGYVGANIEKFQVEDGEFFCNMMFDQ